jgi:hypothetical protein
VVPPPEPKKAGPGGRELETGPEVHWVHRDDWAEHDGMNASSVGYVTIDEERTDIWVNRHFAPLDQAVSKRGLTAEATETRAERYQYPVACGLWLQQHELEKASPKPDESYLASEMRRLAEAVIVAIDPDVDMADAEAED